MPEGAVEEEGQQEKFGRTHEVREGGGDGGGFATPGCGGGRVNGYASLIFRKGRGGGGVGGLRPIGEARAGQVRGLMGRCGGTAERRNG